MRTPGIIPFLLVLFQFSCNSDDSSKQNNPYLYNPIVDLQLNLSLPEYNQLNFPGNSIEIHHQGIRGIVVYNIDNNQYTAFELSDPNHVPSDCSRMQINGIEATCLCTDDDNKYNIVTGQHQTEPSLYPMQRYRAERSGNIITIRN